jgi:hypothetical protein
MADELIDRLDAAIDAVVARCAATAALQDPELAPLVQISADLRHYAGGEFKTRLRAQLERRKTMSTGAVSSIREGFTTVTPYVWVPGRLSPPADQASSERMAFVEDALGNQWYITQPVVRPGS